MSTPNEPMLADGEAVPAGHLRVCTNEHPATVGKQRSLGFSSPCNTEIVVAFW
jgi:hypothetical protein